MSRRPYEPCTKHQRTYCSDYDCKREEANSGSVSMNTDGHLAVGLGSGLAMDLADGSLGIQVGGITVDL